MKLTLKQGLKIQIILLVLSVDYFVLSCREFGFDYDPDCYKEDTPRNLNTVQDEGKFQGMCVCVDKLGN